MEVYFAYEDVEKFMESLDETNRSKASRMIGALEKYGHEVGMPYSKCMGKNLFELRTQGGLKIRMIYTFYKSEAAILYIFFKKTDRIPRHVLSLAEQRRKLLENT